MTFYKDILLRYTSRSRRHKYDTLKMTSTCVLSTEEYDLF